MKAGDLRNRVIIQSKSVTRDGYGAEVITWSTHATVWAAVEPLRGREWTETRQVQADVDTRVRIRYLSTVTPSMRVLWGTRVFEIIAPPIHVQERKRETHLMCREQVNG